MAFTSAHQIRHATDGNACLQVSEAITHSRYACQLCLQRVGNLPEQTRRWFAAIATCVWTVWAVTNQINFAALLRHQFTQAFMHAFKRCFGVITTPNTGLVGRYGDGPASFAQTRYCIDGTRYGNPLIQRLDVGVGVLIDDAVAALQFAA